MVAMFMQWTTGATQMLHLLVQDEWKVSERGKLKGKLLDYFNRLLALGANINSRNHTGETPNYSFSYGIWSLLASNKRSRAKFAV
jgi:hypothetical protein